MLETPLVAVGAFAHDIEALNTRTVGREGLVIGTDGNAADGHMGGPGTRGGVEGSLDDSVFLAHVLAAEHRVRHVSTCDGVVIVNRLRKHRGIGADHLGQLLNAVRPEELALLDELVRTVALLVVAVHKTGVERVADDEQLLLGAASLRRRTGRSDRATR